MLLNVRVFCVCQIFCQFVPTQRLPLSFLPFLLFWLFKSWFNFSPLPLRLESTLSSFLHRFCYWFKEYTKEEEDEGKEGNIPSFSPLLSFCASLVIYICLLARSFMFKRDVQEGKGAIAFDQIFLFLLHSCSIKLLCLLLLLLNTAIKAHENDSKIGIGVDNLWLVLECLYVYYYYYCHFLPSNLVQFRCKRIDCSASWSSPLLFFSFTLSRHDYVRVQLHLRTPFTHFVL